MTRMVEKEVSININCFSDLYDFIAYAVCNNETSMLHAARLEDIFYPRSYLRTYITLSSSTLTLLRYYNSVVYTKCIRFRYTLQSIKDFTDERGAMIYFSHIIYNILSYYFFAIYSHSVGISIFPMAVIALNCAIFCWKVYAPWLILHGLVAHDELGLNNIYYARRFSVYHWFLLKFYY